MPAEARLPQPWRHPVFHEMRVRIEELEEENRQLREQLVPPIVFPRPWRLSRQQSRMLAVLYGRNGLVTRQQMRSAMVLFDPEKEIEDSHLGTVLCRVREKLRPFGIEIETRWAEGFTLTPAGRAIIRAALDDITAGRLA